MANFFGWNLVEYCFLPFQRPDGRRSQWLQMLTGLQDNKSWAIREAARQRLAEKDDVSRRQSGLGGNVYILGAVS